MQIILGDFTTLDGVVQAPGGRDEDTDGVPHAQPGRPHLVGLHLAGDDDAIGAVRELRARGVRDSVRSYDGARNRRGRPAREGTAGG